MNQTQTSIQVCLDFASLVRQFEFAQNVWINDKTFHELGNEHDPIVDTQDGTLDYSIPGRPLRKEQTQLAAFTSENAMQNPCSIITRAVMIEAKSRNISRMDAGWSAA